MNNDKPKHQAHTVGSICGPDFQDAVAAVKRRADYEASRVSREEADAERRLKRQQRKRQRV